MEEDVSRGESEDDSFSCLAADVGSGVAVVGDASSLLPSLGVSASSGSTKGGRSVSGGVGAEGVALRVMTVGGRAEVVRVGAIGSESMPEPVDDVPWRRADLWLSFFPPLELLDSRPGAWTTCEKGQEEPAVQAPTLKNLQGTWERSFAANGEDEGPPWTLVGVGATPNVPAEPGRSVPPPLIAQLRRMKLEPSLFPFMASMARLASALSLNVR